MRIYIDADAVRMVDDCFFQGQRDPVIVTLTSSASSRISV